MSFNFISNLQVASKKTKHQHFTIQLGIEELDAYIPFSDATLFENEVLKVKPTKQSEVKVLVDKYHGILKATR